MIAAPITVVEPDAQRIVTEMFLKAAGPALVKRVAEILGARGIPVMPLKGVLLQKLVYGERSFRSITDIDLLVPERRFFEAFRLLEAAGFSSQRWESGQWQVTLTNPNGPPLGIDLHRRLTRTARSRLTSAGIFARGRTDTQLFDAPVILPDAEDLFAHLLLHATLHWLGVGTLHRPSDFQAVAESLQLDAHRCATHLARQGLTAHAGLMLPLIRAATPAPFVDDLMARLAPPSENTRRPGSRASWRRGPAPGSRRADSPALRWRRRCPRRCSPPRGTASRHAGVPDTKRWSMLASARATGNSTHRWWWWPAIRTRQDALASVLAGLVVLSGLGIVTRFRHAGITWIWAGALAGLAATVGVVWCRRWAGAAPLDDGRLAWGAVAIVAGLAVSIPSAARVDLAAAGTIERALAVAFLLAAVAVRRSGRPLAEAMAGAAAILVGSNLLLFGAGVVLPAHPAFQIAAHQNLRLLPRFYGTGGNPFYGGILMIACIGLVQACPARRIRVASTWIAVALATATLSMVTLAIPALLVWRATRDRRWRAAATIGTVLLAAALLYVHPLRATIFGHSIELGDLHPHYFQQALGPAYMPIQHWGGASWGFEFHGTAYFYLARTALRCFAEHPLGVGAGNFPTTCPVTSMSTYGGWSHANAVHNDYLEQLVEGGVAGFLPMVLLAGLMVKRYRPAGESRWVSGAVVTYIVCGIASAVCFRLPFLALLATQVTSTTPGGAPDRVQAS